MRTREHPSSAAFTLLELVLVLAVIATALAVAAPSLQGWSRGSRLRAATDQFVSTTRWARSQAVADSRVYRLYVDSDAARYWVAVQEGQEFLPLVVGLGRPTDLPAELHIQLGSLDEGAMPMEFVEFSPTGRAWPARVRLTLDDGSTSEIVCASPAEDFRVIPNGGGQS